MTAGSGWLGRLSLELSRSERGTRLSRSEHEGPLRIQRVLTPEGDECPHLYLLHPPGGVVGGDRLETRVSLAEGAGALLTTPAAQKLYRSASAYAEIDNLLTLGAAAKLEWLPSETLAFSGAAARVTTRVQLEAGAAFLGWDIACYGMPARDEAFEAGHVVSRFELFRGATPLLIESFDLKATRELREGAFALRGQPVVANLYAVPASGTVPESWLTAVRAALGDSQQAVASSLQEVLVVRALGRNVEGTRAALLEAWKVLRPLVLSRPATLPRIWAT